MSGQRCHFQGLTGQHLSADNKLLRLDTCGVDSVSLGFPLTTEALGSDMGSWIDWATVFVSSGERIYLLCLRASPLPPTAVEEFVMDAGSLLLVSPARNQEFACVAWG